MESKVMAQEIDQTAEKVRSIAGGVVSEYRAKAEQYVRENPAKTMFSALGIGFVLGLTMFRR
jgi:ElaB/YqjD/DUF883 family membrane-anchored ribosome-binding protein